MNELFGLAVALAGGAMLGALYFALLWFTVARVATVRHPAVLVIASLLVRMGVLLLGLYLLMAGQIERLLAALLGFLLVRVVVVRRVRDRAAGEAS